MTLENIEKELKELNDRQKKLEKQISNRQRI